jgi:hypothetical protein
VKALKEAKRIAHNKGIRNRHVWQGVHEVFGEEEPAEERATTALQSKVSFPKYSIQPGGGAPGFD